MTTHTTLLPHVYAMLHIVHITLHLHYVHVFSTTLQYYTEYQVLALKASILGCQVRTVYDTDNTGWVRLDYDRFTLVWITLG